MIVLESSPPACGTQALLANPIKDSEPLLMSGLEVPLSACGTQSLLLLYEQEHNAFELLMARHFNPSIRRVVS